MAYPVASAVAPPVSKGNQLPVTENLNNKISGSVNRPIIVAQNSRITALSSQDRFLSSQQQLQKLKNNGFIDVGDFSIRHNPIGDGAPIWALKQIIDNYQLVLNGDPRYADRRALSVLVRPLIEGAKLNAPFLVESSPIPDGFVYAARAGNVNVEAVYTNFT
jgi:hypothetical protein